MKEITYRKCLPGHIECIRIQDAQRHEHAFMLNSEYAEIATSHRAFSMWAGNDCLGAAGIVPIFPHRAVAWALISGDIGAYLLPATRKARQFLTLDPTPRIEMTVPVGFDAGHTWARLLGMELETPSPLRKFGASGDDELMYARVR